jgi:DNA-binding CsgD family transcriptional regulator
VNDDAALNLALDLLADHFDSPSACLGEKDAVHGRWMIGSGPVDATRLARYAEISAHDPAPRAFSAIRVGTASTSDRLYSPLEVRRSAFINEYMHPAGLDHSMGSPLYLDARRFALVGVHQACNRKRFDDDDIASLERLSPHVARTLQLRRTFLDLRRKEETFEALVDRRETGMIGRCANRTLFVNRAAQAMAAAADGFALDKTGRPVFSDSAAARQVTRFETDVLLGGPGGIAPVSRSTDARPYIVMVSRLPSDEGKAESDEKGILYSIYDASRRKQPAERVIADILAIPLGPARVVAALIEGHDLRDHSDHAGITLNTVRGHLKTAFAKTGARSQADLVRVALSALASLEMV